MSGGYLGVSVFFTLSGFLITTLLLEEFSLTGKVRIGAFYARRARRLLPASFLCLAGIAVLYRTGVLPTTTRSRGSLLGALFDVANWVQLRGGQSYADVFTAANPVEHYWSLAIEEQFYLLWPLLFVTIAVWLCSRRISRFAVAAVGLYAACVAVGFLVHAGWGSDATYLSTPARAGEVVAGAALAAIIYRRSLPSWIGAVGLVGAALIVVAMITSSANGGWAYNGWLPLFAVLSATVVASSLTESAALTRLLQTSPLVLIGTMSYGIYLYHWPIFIVLSESRTGLSLLSLFVLRLTLTFALAAASFFLVERPIRRSRLSLGPRWMSLSAVAALLAVVMLVDLPPTGISARQQAAHAAAVEIQAPAPKATTPDVADTEGVTGTESANAAAQQPLKILMIGDSTALALGQGVIEAAYQDPGTVQFSMDARGACGLVPSGYFHDDLLTWSSLNLCPATRQQGIDDAANLHPDVIVLFISLSDTWERSWDQKATWHTATEPDYAALIRTSYTAYFEELVKAGDGRPIVWIRPPVAYTIDGSGNTTIEASFTNGGQEIVESVVDEMVQKYPNIVTKLDMRTWFQATDRQSNMALRPDGIHLTVPAAKEVATTWLLPALTATAQPNSPR